MGMNGLDVAGLRPFDLVIPFTIQKGEITGVCWIQAMIDSVQTVLGCLYLTVCVSHLHGRRGPNAIRQGG